MPRGWREFIDGFDRRVAGLMDHWGHPIERLGLGVVFLWFGMLKVVGETSATSIIAKTVYLGPPEVTVTLLGVWEAAIGVCFFFHPTVRVAILLLLLRLPGTGLALVLSFDECFAGSVITPTIQGQYLLKEMTLIGAALVIGGTVRGHAKTAAAPAAATAPTPEHDQ